MANMGPLGLSSMWGENYMARGHAGGRSLGGGGRLGSLPPVAPLANQMQGGGNQLNGNGAMQPHRAPLKSAPCSPQKAPPAPTAPPMNASIAQSTGTLSRAESFHVIHKVPVGDSPYVRAKHVQLVDKDPDRAIALFWAAINAGDRVDSALKDMAIVMKQQNRPEEAIEAIKSLRVRCTEQAQESLDNVLLDLYKRCGRLDDQILLLKHKLDMIHQGSAFNGKRTKTARSQGKKFQVSIEQEATRLLGNLGWAYMQQNNFMAAEAVYRKALSIEPDNNKVCNLGICLMKQSRLDEARSMLQSVTQTGDTRWGSESHLKSYERAQEMLKELEASASNRHGGAQAGAISYFQPQQQQAENSQQDFKASSEQWDLWQHQAAPRQVRRSLAMEDQSSEADSEESNLSQQLWSSSIHGLPAKNEAGPQRPFSFEQGAISTFEATSGFGSASGSTSSAGLNSGSSERGVGPELYHSSNSAQAVQTGSTVQQHKQQQQQQSGITLMQLSQQYHMASYNTAGSAQLGLPQKLGNGSQEGTKGAFSFWEDQYATPPADDCISPPEVDIAVVRNMGESMQGGARGAIGAGMGMAAGSIANQSFLQQQQQQQEDMAWHAQALRLRLEAVQKQWSLSAAPVPAVQTAVATGGSRSNGLQAVGTQKQGGVGVGNGLRADAVPFNLPRGPSGKEVGGRGVHSRPLEGGLSNNRMPLTFDRTNEFVARPPSRTPSPNLVLAEGDVNTMAGFNWKVGGGGGGFGRSANTDSSFLFPTELGSFLPEKSGWSSYQPLYKQLQNENQPAWGVNGAGPPQIPPALSADDSSMSCLVDKTGSISMRGVGENTLNNPPLLSSQKRNRVPTPVKDKKQEGQWGALGFTVSPGRLDFGSVDSVVNSVIGAESVQSSPAGKLFLQQPSDSASNTAETKLGRWDTMSTKAQTGMPAMATSEMDVKRQRRLRIFQEMTVTRVAA